MNRELIAKLFREAFDYCIGEGCNDPWLWEDKFVELVVKECLLCCERVISDPVRPQINNFEQGGIHCIDEIKYHFGVDE